MDGPLPNSPAEWLDEIQLAIADAKGAGPLGTLTGHPLTEANLFHLAPVVALKFRGLDYRDERLRRKVTEGALATYVANSDPECINHGLEQRPLLAFAVCYVTAHFVLDLVDEQEAGAILDYLEERLE